jgi:hypothetical protein
MATGPNVGRHRFANVPHSLQGSEPMIIGLGQKVFGALLAIAGAVREMQRAGESTVVDQEL